MLPGWECGSHIYPWHPTRRHEGTSVPAGVELRCAANRPAQHCALVCMASRAGLHANRRLTVLWTHTLACFPTLPASLPQAPSHWRSRRQ